MTIAAALSANDTSSLGKALLNAFICVSNIDNIASEHSHRGNMKRQILHTLCFTAAITSIAIMAEPRAQEVAQSASQTPAPIPKFLLDYLRNTNYYEDYVAIILRDFRQYAGDDQILTQQKVDALKKRQTASSRAAMMQQIFQADLNGDGKVTYQEAEDFLTSGNSHEVNMRILDQWFALDTNGDKVITLNEILKMNTTESSGSGYRLNAPADFLTLDNDKDGKVTLAEVKSAAQQAFAAYDTNSDGVLSNDERAPLNNDYTVQPATHMEKLVISKDAELHAVSVYEGDIGKEKMVHGEAVNITVDRPGKEVVLLLGAYNVARWNIIIQKSTKLTAIYYSDYTKHPQILVNGKSFADAKPLSFQYAYQAKGRSFRQLLNYVYTTMGRDHLDSFIGEYHAKPEGYLINAISTDTELKKDRLVVVSPKDLPKLTFVAKLNGQTGIYDLSGKQLQKLPDALVKAAYVEKQKQYYVLDGDNGIRVLDEKGNTLSVIPTSPDVPRFSWPTDITYNAKLNAIAVSSLGGEGFLYHYSLANKKWTAVSLHDVDYNSFQYDRETNGYIATTTMGIKELAVDGAPAKDLDIDISKQPGFEDTYDQGNGPEPSVKVIPKKEYVIIIVSEDALPRIYLFNRATKQLNLTFAAVPQN